MGIQLVCSALELRLRNNVSLTKGISGDYKAVCFKDTRALKEDCENIPADWLGLCPSSGKTPECVWNICDT